MADSSGESDRIKVGLLTVSDSCYLRTATDKSGRNLRILIEQQNIIDGIVEVQEIVPDELVQIKEKLLHWSDNLKLDLVLTTGGTGFAPRDVTPEATKEVLEKEAPGLTIAMLKGSLDITPMAMLTRLACGIRGRTLILNLPGSTKGSQECLSFVTAAIPHAVDLLRERKEDIQMTHQLLEASAETSKTPSKEAAEVESPPDPSSHVGLMCPSPLDHQHTHVPFTDVSQPDKQKECDDSTEQELIKELSNARNILEQLYVNSQTGEQQSTHHDDFVQVLSVAAVPDILVENCSQVEADPNIKDSEENKTFETSTDSGSEIGNTTAIGLGSSHQEKETRRRILPLGKVKVMAESTLQGDVYEFPEDDDSRQTHKSGRRHKRVLKRRTLARKDFGEIAFVNSGMSVKEFLKTHPLIRGIYLNKGKRDLKRQFVVLRRAQSAIDKGSWKRAGRIHERNRFDDLFELTELGRMKQQQIIQHEIRDVYVVNWYVWCPGRGNCQRKCGGLGKCIAGCQGMLHKQDRHNCSLMINLKLYLSDVTKWHIHITGSHVPVGLMWELPLPEGQRINEDTRDVIISSSENATTTQIQDLLFQKQGSLQTMFTPSKRKICRFVSSMKKRRSERDYNVRKRVLSSTLDQAQQTLSIGPVGKLAGNQGSLVSTENSITLDTQGMESEKCNASLTSTQTSIERNLQGRVISAASMRDGTSNGDNMIIVYEVMDVTGNASYVKDTSRNCNLNQNVPCVPAGTESTAVIPSENGSPVRTLMLPGQSDVGETAQAVYEQDLSSLGDIGVLLLTAYQHQQ